MVEARNRHIKSIFKFFNQLIQVRHVPNPEDFYQIAGAIINKYHSVLIVAAAQRLLERAMQLNVLQSLVELKNLHYRNGERCVLLAANQLLDFSILTIQYLRDLTAGV